MIKLKFQPFNLEIFLELAVWQKKFAWWPKTCIFSRRIIWLETGHKGVAVWTGLNTDINKTVSITEIKWATNDAYAAWLLENE